MKQWEEKVGKSFLDRLDEVVVSIGRDVITRRQLVENCRCGNFSAAVNLNWALQRFKPQSVKELMRRVSIEELFAIKGVGVTTIYVWMCILQAAGKDPLDWLDREVKIPTLYANRGKKNRRSG